MELERVAIDICKKAISASFFWRAGKHNMFFDKLLEIVDLIYSVTPPQRIEDHFLSALKKKKFDNNGG